MAGEEESLEDRKERLEISKLEAEIRALTRWPISYPSAYVPLIVALIGLAGTYLTLSHQRNDAELQFTAAQSQTEAFEAALPDSTLEAIQTVEINFRGSITRAQITGLQQDLNALSRVVAGVPNRTSEISRSRVLYAKESDYEFAADIANRTRTYFLGLECPMEITAADSASSLPLGSVVLDVFHNCR